MENYLDTIDELFAKYKALQPLKAEDKARLDKKFRLEFNYNSNHIEGNTLTYGETELLLIFGNTTGNHSKRELDEMQAHDTAYQLIQDWAEDGERTLTEQDIKELNKVILVSPFWKDAKTLNGQDTRTEVKIGSYKEQPNFVRFPNGEKLDFPSPADTLILMRELIDWYRNEQDSLHPIALATILHHKLVSIHPFDDGNGRVARLLMNYVLLRDGYPPVIIKSSDKPAYLQSLRIADVGDYGSLLDYVSQQVVWSLKTSIKAANGESLEEADDFIKEIELLKRKATAKGEIKSLQLTNDVFTQTFSAAYSSLLNTLKYFDSLFARNSESFDIEDVETGVNFLKEADFVKEVTHRLDPSSNLRHRGPEHYETQRQNIKSISWDHRMHDMIGTDDAINTNVTLTVIFKKYSYELLIKVHGALLFGDEKRYNNFFSAIELETVNNKLKGYLLKFVKERIN